jgi:Arm DNA-binding domain
MWDTKQHGLALRTQPTGAKSWYCVYSRQGRPRWYRLGNADAIGLDSARVLAAEAMLAVAKGGDPAADKKAERGKGTFEELATRYVEEHAKKVNKSWRQGDTLVRRYALPRWGKLQASSITRTDIKAMMASIANVDDRVDESARLCAHPSGRGPGARQSGARRRLGSIHVGSAGGDYRRQSLQAR